MVATTSDAAGAADAAIERSPPPAAAPADDEAGRSASCAAGAAARVAAGSDAAQPTPPIQTTPTQIAPRDRLTGTLLPANEPVCHASKTCQRGRLLTHPH